VPHAAAHGLDLVRALAGGLRAGAVDEAVAEAAADALDAYAEQKIQSLDAAFGLIRTQGQRDARARAAMAERDRLLREAAARFFPKLTPTEQAKALETALARYAASAWQRERAAPELPPRHKAKIEEYLWRVMRAEPRTLGWERIRKILVTSSAYS
jgi:hypothetical protein